MKRQVNVVPRLSRTRSTPYLKSPTYVDVAREIFPFGARGSGIENAGGAEGRPRSTSSAGVAPQPLTAPGARKSSMIPIARVCGAELS